MAEAVASTVESNPNHAKVVMGHFADTVALAAPIKGINDKMGSQPFEERLKQFNPGYYLFVGSVNDLDAVSDFDYDRPGKLQESYRLTLLDTFDVYPGRIYQKPVFFLSARSEINHQQSR